MDICFITDSNYVLPTMTAIKSLIINNKKEKLSVYVLGYKLSENECVQILKLRTKNADISVIDESDKRIDIGKEHFYVSNSALLKFYLPVIFSDKDRILYLDGDILVKRNLKDFYLTDFENKYAVVVKDMLATKSGYGEQLELDNYFNSGVMLLNLKKMREDNITEKLVDYKLNKDPGPFMDQNAFNKVFDNKVKYMDLKYNFQEYNLSEFGDKEITNFYNVTYTELQDIRNNHVILHMTNFYKPWKFVNFPRFKDFVEYLLKLPDCEIKNLTIKKIFKSNYIMLFKYYLRQNVLFSKLIDYYENIRYKK